VKFGSSFVEDGHVTIEEEAEQQSIATDRLTNP